MRQTLLPILIVAALLPLLLCQLESVSGHWTPPDRAVERAALLDLFNATGGPWWTMPWNTSADVDHCTWAGVCCMNVTWDPTAHSLSPVNCPKHSLGTVVWLSLAANNMTGTIPESIGNLFGLQKLRIIFAPSIHGPLPASVSQLTLLRVLDFSECAIESPLPDLSGSTLMEQILLTENQLTGNLGNTTFPFTWLQMFSVSGNTGLTGPIPFGWLSQCTHMEIADFSKTGMQATSKDIAPLVFEQAFTTNYPLLHMTCDDVGLPGQNSFIVVDPQYFYYQTCVCEPSYTGPAPNCTISAVGVLTSVYTSTGGPHWTVQTGWNQLKDLDATNDDEPNYCAFFGICCGDTALLNATTRTCNTTAGGTVVGIYLDQNNLIGVLPGAISFFDKVEVLSAGGNKLIGSLPLNVWNLQELRSLNMSSNSLNGTFPIYGANVPKLQSLYLSSTKINAMFAPEWSAFSALEKFYFDDGIFVGAIGDLMFTSMPNLREFSMVNSELISDLPNALFQLPNITLIDLRMNTLMHTIPTSVGSASKLTSLSLSNNILIGTIPTEIGNMSSIKILDLGSNQLNGTIPTEMAGLLTLQTLMLRNNRLSGNISEHNLPNRMIFFDVSNNAGIDGDVPFDLILADHALFLFDVSRTSVRPSNQSEIDEYLTFSTIDYLPNATYECPMVAVKGGSVFLAFFVTPEYYNYEHCVCYKNYRGVAPNCIHHTKMSIGAIVGIVVGAIAAIGVIGGILYFTRSRSKDEYKSVV